MGDRSLDDEDFEYGHHQEDEDNFEDDGMGRASQLVTNQPHDEEVALSDTDSFGHPDSPPKNAPRGGYDQSMIESNDMDEPARSQSPESYNKVSAGYEPQGAKPNALAAVPSEAMFPAAGTNPSGVSDDGAGAEVAGAYNAQDFKHLNVSDEVRELFKHIGRYTPHTIELDTKLKPFMPDYIPCVGGIDEFIKVPRPDGKPDFLGLKVLDEPALRQSDPTVLTLQLRQHTKEASGVKAEMIGRIEHADENKAKKITQWISSINDIHKTKPAATISYSRRMPDIETLMQEWPPEMEAFLKNMKLPSGELDLDLKTYTKMLCGILDIPVYDNPIESLHVLFSLYLEFKSNPIFKQQLDMDRGYLSGGLATGGTGEEGGGAPSQWMGMGGAESGGGANVFTF